LRRNSKTSFQKFVLDHRQQLRRIPALLAADSDESSVMIELIQFILGKPTTQVPQCAVLSIPVSEDYASAMFLGGAWALTALHALSESGSYVVSLPVSEVAEVAKVNSFEVAPTPAPHNADLALLRMNGIPNSTVDAIPLASVADLATAGSVQLCGFGSDSCDVLARAGIKRLSDPFPVLSTAAAAALGIDLDPATQFVVKNTPSAPLVCLSDSGGAALIATGGGKFKLAGIITDQVASANGVPLGVICVRVSAFADWIGRLTGLPSS